MNILKKRKKDRVNFNAVALVPFVNTLDHSEPCIEELTVGFWFLRCIFLLLSVNLILPEQNLIIKLV